MRRFLALLIALLALAAPVAAKERPLVILISIDGFRPDYLARGVTPTLARLAAEGASGAMRPSFPSKTFPNHYTLVTGLRPDRHGIVDNTMRDPVIPGVVFSMGNKAAVADRQWWDGGVPVWVSAERAGVKSGTMFWPGSEAAIQGVRPSLWRPFDQSVKADLRTDQVLAWLDLPKDERPRFVTLYFDDVDTAGHIHGPASPQVNPALERVDAAMKRLVDGLKARGLAANLVIVADHGMAETSRERVIVLDDILSPEVGTAQGWGAFLALYPAAGREADAETALLRPHDHMECWRKADIPARFRYGKNPRVAPLFCLPTTGWEIQQRARLAAVRPIAGAHGYDNFSPDMLAVFIGHGPAFRRGKRPAVFDNVDVYPLLMRLTGLKPEPSDGDLDELRPVLR